MYKSSIMLRISIGKLLSILLFTSHVFSRPAPTLEALKTGSFEQPLHRRYTAEGNITEDDYDYLASVSIGGQHVNLLLDTATSLL